MRFLSHESLRVVLLNAKQQLLKVATVSQGSVNETIAHPREIFKPVIVHSAYSFRGPVHWNHINLTDDYSWRQNERVEKGGFGSLRFPPPA
jgi:hypothetical protein